MQQLEHEEQKTLVEWAQWQLNTYPGLDLLYAIPNGGYRFRKTASYLMAEGVKAGVPDLCLPAARREYHGLYIEMKSSQGVERDSQAWWRKRLTEEGYKAVVCYSADAAIQELTRYLAV